MPWGVWLSLTLKVIKSLILFLKLFCIMGSPHNSFFTSTDPATLFSAFLPAAQAATAGWVLYPTFHSTSGPVNPQTGLMTPSLTPRRKTQWQVSSLSLRGRKNRHWLDHKVGMSQGQGRRTKYSSQPTELRKKLKNNIKIPQRKQKHTHKKWPQSHYLSEADTWYWGQRRVAYFRRSGTLGEVKRKFGKVSARFTYCSLCIGFYHERKVQFCGYSARFGALPRPLTNPQSVLPVL